MLNWIVLNRTDYLHKMDLTLNNLQRLICHKTQQTSKPCSTDFSVSSQGPGTNSSFCFLSIFLCGQSGQQNPQFCKFSFFVVDYYKVCSSGRDFMIRLYVKIQGVCASHSPRKILACAYTICSHGETLISWTILNGSPCELSRIESHTLSVPISCIRWLCDWSFRLYHHITYTCSFVVLYLLLLWYD